MGAVGNTVLTLADHVKRMAPNGSIMRVVEALTRRNNMLQDIHWEEGNLPTGHRYGKRTALPGLTWRRINQGIDPTKSHVGTEDETVGMLEGMSQVDVDLAALNGNSAAFRQSEDMAFLQSFNQEVARAMIYESTALNPDRPQGFAPRLNTTTANPAAAQIIKADASASGADQTSIWLAVWGEKKLYGVFPKGSPGGLTPDDLGKQLVEDAAGKRYRAWVTHWQWKCGFVIEDYRYIARICNIDTSAWKADLSAGANLYLRMLDAYAAIESFEGGNPVWYMNRSTFTMFNAQLLSKSVNLLEYFERGGRRIPHFLGIPIRIEDAITSSESVVS